MYSLYFYYILYYTLWIAIIKMATFKSFSSLADISARYIGPFQTPSPWYIVCNYELAKCLGKSSIWSPKPFLPILPP